jgi:type III pantothenate kinase
MEIFSEGVFRQGLMMRFNAVHNFTARLPLVPLVEEAPLIGDSTESCIQSGVINGLIEELSGIIRLYSRNLRIGCDFKRRRRPIF